MMKFYVYVIQSKVNNSLYKGLTMDVEKRLSEHNAKRTFATKPYCPWFLVFVKEFDDRNSARAYEKFLKSGQGRDFLNKTLKRN